MCYIVFISHSLHWRYIKIALQEYVIKRLIAALVTSKFTSVKIILIICCQNAVECKKNHY